MLKYFMQKIFRNRHRQYTIVQRIILKNISKEAGYNSTESIVKN